MVGFLLKVSLGLPLYQAHKKIDTSNKKNLWAKIVMFETSEN